MIWFNNEQHVKAYFPIIVTDGGIVAFFSYEQYANTKSPILTPIKDGINACFNDLQIEKAYSQIDWWLNFH